jgi:hypothetical protein
MCEPTDQGAVARAIRLGWSMSEYRGRTHPSSGKDGNRPSQMWPDHALPLEEERSNLELGREAERILCSFARELVDPLSPVPTDPPTEQKCSEFVQALGEQLRELEKKLAEAPDDKDLSSRCALKWNQLAEVLYKWDAALQDTLSQSSTSQLTGYNLGRALADTYWALDPKAVDGIAVSWTHLLGSGRRALIGGYLGRLAALFDPLTTPAIAGSLAAWGEVAANPSWRGSEGALGRLGEQVRRWYGLVVVGQNPRTFLRPMAIFRNWRSTSAAARALLPSLAMLFIGFGAAATLSVLIATHRGASYLNALLGVVGALGVTSAAFSGWVKATTQGLSKRLRNDAYSDAVAVGVAILPERRSSTLPVLGSASRTRARVLKRAVRERDVNAPTDTVP